MKNRLEARGWRLEASRFKDRFIRCLIFASSFELRASSVYVMLLSLSIGLMSCSRPQNDLNTLNLHLDTDPTTLDPAFITDVKSGRLSALLYDTLLRYDANMTLIPGLANSWEVSEDGITYTFILKKGTPFSNGHILNSQDVKYSFERLANSITSSPRAWILQHVRGYDEFRSNISPILAGFKIQSPEKFSLELSEPFAPFLSLLTLPNASILYPDINKPDLPIGTGPFILKKWRHDYEILFARNDHYYNDVPKITQIRFRIIKETIFVSSEFRRGKLDIIEIPNTELALYMKDPQWKDQIFAQNNLSLYYLGFNCARSPFNRREVRQSIAKAIDRNLLIETLRKHRSIPIPGPIPPGVFGHEPSLQMPLSDSSSVQLKSFSDKTFTLLQSSNEETLELSEAIQAQLKIMGFNIIISEAEWSSFKSSLKTGQFDLFLMSWWADYPDGENFLFPLFHSSNIGGGGNYTRFQNTDVDALILKSHQIASHEKRKVLYDQIQKIIIEESPMVFLYSSRSLLIKQPWIRGFTPHPLYNGNKLTKVEKTDSMPS